jgi:hypothetical protein
MRRIANPEQGAINDCPLSERPQMVGLPEGPMRLRPDAALARLPAEMWKLRARGYTRPIAWIPTNDLLALRDRLGVTKGAVA